MTIAIGEMLRFGKLKGALVCADSRIVSSDLATTSGAKVHLSLTPRRSAFAIADAAEDGDAAKMLAQDITKALCAESVVHMGHVPELVKRIMTEWYAAYTGGRAPSTQFVLAAAVNGVCNLFYCSLLRILFSTNPHPVRSDRVPELSSRFFRTQSRHYPMRKKRYCAQPIG